MITTQKGYRMNNLFVDSRIFIYKLKKFQMVCINYNFYRSTRLQHMFDEFK